MGALREEERGKLEPLRARLKSEKDPEVRAGLKAEIKSIRREFKEKRRAAATSLFSLRSGTVSKERP